SLLRKLRLISNNIKIIHTERGLYTKYSNMLKKVFLFFMKELEVFVTTTQFNMNYWKESILQKGLQMDFKIIENTAGELFETYDPNRERPKDNKLIVGFAGRYAD